MSNFWKQQVAQESAGAVLEPGSIELPAEAVETHLSEAASDTAEIELLDRDQAVLSDDADETEAQLEVVEESDEEMTEGDVESLDVAQESIRKRWCIERRSVAHESASSSRSRRMVAQESLVDDIKALIQRFIAWLKEQGRKVKDRWLKFHNAGKTIQKRAKKFDNALKKLGSKSKDTISGGFIKQLSIGAEFVGADTGKLNEALKKAQDSQGAQASLYESMADAVKAKLEGGADKLGQAIHAGNAKSFAPDAGTTAVLGHYSITVEKDGGDDYFSKLEFVETEGDVKDEVETPSSSLLASLVDFYNKVGKELEKELQAYQKTDKARQALEESMENILKSIGKAEEDKAKADAAKAARKYAQAASTKASTIARVGAHLWKVLPSGLNGYIAAGIGAYGKK